jgi:protein-S-isoprenylcysteine O-methyltransferase Ste14
MTVDRLEDSARRLGAIVAFGAAMTAIPGMARAVRSRGPRSGRPELVFTPLRVALISAAWGAGSAAAWRPLPLRPGPAARGVLAIVGLGIYLTGIALAVSGRCALGRSYAPSSTLGLTLADEPRLVTSGPFAMVRHPMYVGLALASIGAVLLYRS